MMQLRKRVLRDLDQIPKYDWFKINRSGLRTFVTEDLRVMVELAVITQDLKE